MQTGNPKRFFFCDILCYRWYSVKQAANHSKLFSRQILRCAHTVSPKPNVGTFKPLRQRYGFDTNLLGELTAGHVRHLTEATVRKLAQMVNDVLGEQFHWTEPTLEQWMADERNNPGLKKLAMFRTPRRLRKAGKAHWEKLTPEERTEQIGRMHARRWTPSMDKASIRSNAKRIGFGRRYQFKARVRADLARYRRKLGHDLTATQLKRWLRDEARRLGGMPMAWVLEAIHPRRGRPREIDRYLTVQKYPGNLDKAVDEIASREGITFSSPKQRDTFKEHLRIGHLQAVRRDANPRL